jgi:nitroreductase
MKEDKIPTEIRQSRKFDYPIDPLLQNRWSPRSMTGEEMSVQELMPLFEAARWAPSSYNNQPWRFLYARRNTPSWDLFFDLMIDFNKGWTKNAAALVVVISHTTFEKNNKPSVTHSYDTGSAWMSLALEGASRGYVVHGMEGFDYEKARKVLEIPKDYQVEAMAAIGKRAPKEKLPPELQERETPTPRKPLSEIVIEGKFKSS